jgi:hypothetical protein
MRSSDKTGSARGGARERLPESFVSALLGALVSGLVEAFDLPVWLHGLTLGIVLLAIVASARRGVSIGARATNWIIAGSVGVGMLVGIGGVHLLEATRCESQVGEGHESFGPAFKEAYESFGGRPRLGCPINPAHAWGGGVIQDLRGGTAGSAAIMALHPRSAVVLGGPMWRYYESIGTEPGQAAYLAGYPIGTERGQGRIVRLAGGGCGDGLLVRSPSSGVVRWVFGPVYLRYLREGGPAGDLGFPVSGTEFLRARVIQRFEGGEIQVTTGSNPALSKCIG